MPITARQARGRRTQVVLAAWLRNHGWPGVRSPVGAERGQDIKGDTGDHSIEVKARSDFDPRAWLLQAKKNAQPGQRPCAVIRCNGQGENDVGEFLVIRRLEDDELNLSREQARMEQGRRREWPSDYTENHLWGTRSSSSQTACWLSTAMAWMPGSVGT